MYLASRYKPRFDLGQHFLTIESRAESLVDQVDDWHPAEILEIGAGLGTLSRAILRRGYRLWAIEKDQRMAAVLEECGLDHEGRMRLTIADVHEVAIEDELGHDAAMVSILPFDHDLSALILSDIFTRVTQLSRAIVVIPDSVATLISASPGLRCEVLGCPEAEEFTPAYYLSLSMASITRI
jgi:16S rRNA A1518/A1519 N6-dimethyltransferase RsmA/KsgA/DIM1 with predicted DNA glycosylase/AP lyase activity